MVIGQESINIAQNFIYTEYKLSRFTLLPKDWDTFH